MTIDVAHLQALRRLYWRTAGLAESCSLTVVDEGRATASLISPEGQQRMSEYVDDLVEQAEALAIAIVELGGTMPERPCDVEL